MDHRGARRAFTLIEALILTAILVIAIVIFLPAMGGNRCRGTRQLKDSTQVRGILQGMTIWAQGSHDEYVKPSSIDKENLTVAAAGAAKDTTANIYSILISNGFVPPEMFYSPAEANANIKVYEDYEFSAPKAAVNPSKALWDPAFSADFTNGKTGHTSYAHILPTRPGWSSTFNADEAVIGNRGPQITAVNNGAPVFSIPDSTTLLIHGSKKKWEGNIAYNDNRVDFETTPSGESTYKDASGAERPDFFHFDEPDDAAGTNAYLGIFTTAGATPEAFTAIWD